MKRRRFMILAAALALLLVLPGCTPEPPEATAAPTPEPTAKPTAVLAVGTAPPAPELTAQPSPVPTLPPGVYVNEPVLAEYVPVTEGLVIDCLHVEYDQPYDYRLNFTFPMLQSDLPGAETFNDAISADWAYYLTTDPAHFLEEGDCANFDYSFMHIWYEVYSFGQIHEIVVRYQEYSLYGSGPYSFNIIYGYDSEEGVMLSLTELMERVGLTEEDVYNFYLNTYYDPYLETFDELVNFFYFDGQKQLYLEPNE